MGICGSKGSAGNTQQDSKNKKIEREMNAEARRAESVIKLLLLGAGESGKSTIFKQMKILYGVTWDEEELIQMRPVVHSNIIQNLKLVLEHMETKSYDTECPEEIKEISLVPDEVEITPELGAKIKKIWQDKGVQECWAERASFQVLDCVAYYCNRIDAISQPGYAPDEMDILQARVRTSGIVEEKYQIDGVPFTMFDVGGQRNERKKWIHCFDNVTAVIFVAAINEYDQVLYEDSQTNRVDEAIKLFDEICNSSWFKKTSMILFLNKSDLFEEKLFKTPLRVVGTDEVSGRNEDFEGPYAEDEGVDRETAILSAQAYILSLFTQKKKDHEKEIYSHVTCATDTSNVFVVFNSCKDIILRQNLVHSGFMD